MPHKRFQACHAKGVIDAEIAEKGHLWTENLIEPGDRILKRSTACTQ